MELLTYGGIVGIVLYIVHYLIRRAKADEIISQLSRKNRSEDLKEQVRLEQGVEDAKKKYNDARAELARITKSSADV